MDDESGLLGNVRDWLPVVAAARAAGARELGARLGLPAIGATFPTAGDGIGLSPCRGPCGAYDIINGAGACVLICGTSYVLTPADQQTNPWTSPGLALWQYLSPATGSSINARLRYYRPWSGTPSIAARQRAITAPRTRTALAVAWPGAQPEWGVQPILRPPPFGILRNLERVNVGWPQGFDGGYDGNDTPTRPRSGSINGVPIIEQPPTDAPDGPPGPNTRERKFGRQIAARALSQFSESRDIIEALYGALSPAVRQREACTRADTACQISALFRNIDKIDPVMAGGLLALNELEDRAHGRVRGGAQREANRLGFGSAWQDRQGHYLFR